MIVHQDNHLTDQKEPIVQANELDSNESQLISNKAMPDEQLFLSLQAYNGNRQMQRFAKRLHKGSATEPIQTKAGSLSKNRKNHLRANSNNRALPKDLQAGIEVLSGLSMTDVRVHFNSAKPQQLGALAYTQGTEIYIAPGQEKHLPHEAWHVAQQKQGRVRPTTQVAGFAVNDDAQLEAEAERMGRRGATFPLQLQATAKVHVSEPTAVGNGRYKIVASNSGQQAGSVMVHERENAIIEVTDLQVDPKQRKQGLGQELIASAAQTGRQLGKSKMKLDAQDKGSGRLTNWYKRMGFTQIGTNRLGFPHLEANVHQLVPTVIQAMQKDPNDSPSSEPTQTTSKKLSPTEQLKLLELFKSENSLVKEYSLTIFDIDRALEIAKKIEMLLQPIYKIASKQERLVAFKEIKPKYKQLMTNLDQELSWQRDDILQAMQKKSIGSQPSSPLLTLSKPKKVKGPVAEEKIETKLAKGTANAEDLFVDGTFKAGKLLSAYQSTDDFKQKGHFSIKLAIDTTTKYVIHAHIEKTDLPHQPFRIAIGGGSAVHIKKTTGTQIEGQENEKHLLLSIGTAMKFITPEIMAEGYKILKK